MLNNTMCFPCPVQEGNIWEQMIGCERRDTIACGEAWRIRWWGFTSNCELFSLVDCICSWHATTIFTRTLVYKVGRWLQTRMVRGHFKNSCGPIEKLDEHWENLRIEYSQTQYRNIHLKLLNIYLRISIYLRWTRQWSIRMQRREWHLFFFFFHL